MAIDLSSKAEDVKLDAVELLDMNDNVISVRPLKEISVNFYVAEQQLPPTSMFKIAVGKRHFLKAFVVIAIKTRLMCYYR